MIRPALAMFAGLMCGVIGQRQARRLREEGANLRRWEQLLRRLALLLREGTLSLPEALRQSTGESSAPDLLLRRLGDEMEQHPLSPLPELYARIAPPGPEAPVLARLMAQLPLAVELLQAWHKRRRVRIRRWETRLPISQRRTLLASSTWRMLTLPTLSSCLGNVSR